MTGKMEEMRKEYDTKLDEYAALLDIRANRIKVGALTDWTRIQMNFKV